MSVCQLLLKHCLSSNVTPSELEKDSPLLNPYPRICLLCITLCLSFGTLTIICNNLGDLCLPPFLNYKLFEARKAYMCSTHWFLLASVIVHGTDRC